MSRRPWIAVAVLALLSAALLGGGLSAAEPPQDDGQGGIITAPKVDPDGGAPTDLATQPTPPKQIFAHYMGCYPVNASAIAHHRAEAPALRHDSGDYVDGLGGRIRHWPIAPPGTRLDADASADLEIRRALRIGLDGFAIDAWAGQDTAKATLDALFRVAEAKDYPFQLTICLDQSCHAETKLGPRPESVIVGFTNSIQWLLEKHGDSPKLARRDGKPLIFGYSSRITPRLKGPEDAATWGDNVAAWDEIRRRVGTPLYIHYAMEHFFSGADLNLWPGARPPHNPAVWMVRATAAMAGHFEAVGAFVDTDMYPELGAMAAATKAAGAEWSQPLWHQYQNVRGSLHVQPGTDIARDRWRLANATGSTLIQYVTWNDFGEATNLTPDYLQRYTMYDLTGYEIARWKAGAEPPTDHDRVYLIYRQALRGEAVYPFHSRRTAPGVLEVRTWLTAPATVRLPGRPETWEAPAGMSVHQVPLQVGPVAAELWRGHSAAAGGGERVLRLDAPEPVSDRPFREENTAICYSTEFERHWAADFGAETPTFTASMYGDADGDGLPNWFEMYWFGSWLDWTTAAAAEPDADPDGDGRTNLQEYRDRTDPTQPLPVYTAGYIWDIEDVYRGGMSYNPDAGADGQRVWRYLYRLGTPPIAADTPWLVCPNSAASTGYTGPMVHSAPYRDARFGSVYGWIDRRPREPRGEGTAAAEDTVEVEGAVEVEVEVEGEVEGATAPVVASAATAPPATPGFADGARLRFLPRTNCTMAVAWDSPIAGTVRIETEVYAVDQGAVTLRISRAGADGADAPGEPLAQRRWTALERGAMDAPVVAVQPGDRLLIIADSEGANTSSLILETLRIVLVAPAEPPIP